MRILVIDDKQNHRDSATETLKGHEVSVASSYDEATRLMEPAYDEAIEEKHLRDAGVTKQNPAFVNTDEGKERWKAYWAARKSAHSAAEIPFPFEVVLTDMMMPMGDWNTLRDACDPSQQIPYGFVLALRAAQRGAKWVAMVTDTNHHKGAMSAAIDCIGDSYYSGKEADFQINGAKVRFVHAPFCEDGISKDWGRVLADLVK
ncbi:MAG: hypothetical protein AAB413_01010 [Patescibacteria group bacterium]